MTGSHINSSMSINQSLDSVAESATSLLDDNEDINPSSQHSSSETINYYPYVQTDPPFRKRAAPYYLRHSSKLHPPKRLRRDYHLDAIEVIHKYL